MKIRAVRLREVGIFREPVAVEGFSGGLDVLAGPNELGKSTILRALDRLFFLQPSSKHKDIEQLRPTTGGAPMIEADFEVAGRLWRLRKQFLTGRGIAELTDVATGQIRERGTDAHARTLELIGLSGTGDRGPLGLLWVSQEDGPQPVLLGADQRGLLLSAIEAEVAEVSAGHSLRALRARIAAELEPLVTAKTQRPRGEYDRALKEADRLDAELRAAQAQARLVAEQQAKLAELRTRHAASTDPAQLAAAQQELLQARKAVETARDAREKRKLAEVTRLSRDSEQRRIDGEAKALRAQLAERDRLGSERTALVARIATAASTAATGTAAAQTAEAQRQACATQVQAARETLRHRDLNDTLAELRQRQQTAQSAAAEHARITQELAAMRATPALVRKAASEHDSIVRLQALLDASAPRVTIAYLPGVRSAITSAGTTLADGSELRPTRPLVLEIAGVGRITIAPVAADLDDTHADLDAHRTELQTVLTGMGVADLDAAREALTRRRELETSLTALVDRLATLASDGLPSLDAQVSAAEAAVTATTPAAPPPTSGAGSSRPILLQRVHEQEAALRGAEQTATVAVRTAGLQAQELAALQSTLQAADARRATLDAELAPMADPPARLATLETELAAATVALNAIVRDVAAWQESAPADGAFVALQTTVTQREQAITAAAATAIQLSQEVSHLEGQLVGSGDDDVALRIDELTGAVQRARLQVRHFADEVAALALLDRLIGEAEATSQDRFLAPVLARIEPYLRTVLPEARLQLSKELAPSALVRGDAAEHLATLSGGTQEQLAILTRLGFGRLLAEQGHAAPVILDDALVYSDDLRLGRLFDVLRTAAQHHQVIVLTCHARLFEPLGGTRLMITPWRVAT